jgi:peptide/nickel transport system permease protein
VIRGRLAAFGAEYLRDRSGAAGLALMAVFVAAAIFEPLLVPFPEAGRRWHDIAYWADNPRSAPPVWAGGLGGNRAAPQAVVRRAETVSQDSGGPTLVRRSFAYDYAFDEPPRDAVVRYTGTGDIPTVFAVTRPDGVEIELARTVASAGEAGSVRLSAALDGRDAIAALFAERGLAALAEAARLQPAEALFAQLAPDARGTPRPLHGRYTFTLTTLLLDAARKVEDPRLVITGRVSGLLGTDDAKRDLWSGLVGGIKWALLIGVLTAAVSVSLGVAAGVVSAWYGGWVDRVIQRVFEIVVNMPLLPLLIILSAVFRLSIWAFTLVMCLSFWTGPVKTVYSMALQIKEETYIEAARALGARSGRIILRHMVPLLAPYAFAAMALYVPGAVVYEATVSLLGLGDATIVSWGQILHDAFAGAAVLNRLWWWVIPPGLMIALVGMAFAFVGFAMDRVLHPRLRTR